MVTSRFAVLCGLAVSLSAVGLSQALPPVGGGTSSAATQQSTSATNQQAQKPPETSVKPQDPNSKTIGKLGQATSETNIYSSMSTGARVLWKLKSYQYLVINPTKYEKWTAVLLSNGKTGYMLTEKVAELPYDVQVPKSYSMSSRGVTPPRSSGRATGNPTDKQSMLEYSYRYIGTKYVWGGNSLTNGIDCSGFVQQLFGKIGESLPRTAAEQAKVGQQVNRLEDLQPGDRLYFWDSKRGKIGHTGIFLGFFADGGAYFIHSSTTNKGVATDDLREKKWLNMLVAARR